MTDRPRRRLGIDLTPLRTSRDYRLVFIGGSIGPLAFSARANERNMQSVRRRHRQAKGYDMAVKVLILEDNPAAREFLGRVVRESFSDTITIVEAGDL